MTTTATNEAPPLTPEERADIQALISAHPGEQWSGVLADRYFRCYEATVAVLEARVSDAEQRAQWAEQSAHTRGKQLRSTHTFAELEVSIATYDEIRGKLDAAGYSHAFVDAAIDMHGIGLVKARCAVHGEDCTGDAWPSCKETPADYGSQAGVIPAAQAKWWKAEPLTKHERDGILQSVEYGGARTWAGEFFHRYEETVAAQEADAQAADALRVLAEQSQERWRALLQDAVDERDALRAAGTALSNLAYNLAQLTSLDAHVRRQLDEARKAWDAQLAQGGGS